MNTTVIIPGALRKFTNNIKTVKIKALTVGELLKNLINTFPDLKEHLLDEKNHVRRFINVFLNEEDIRFLKDQETKLENNDVIELVPAISGG